MPGLLFEQVHAQVANRDHDGRGVAFTDAAGVLAEDDIDSPM
jgi:hypothetical protein